MSFRNKFLSFVFTFCGLQAVATKASAGTEHRFRIPLGKAAQLQFAGKKIFIYGLFLSGGTNNLVGQSGQFSIPDVTQALRLSDITRSFNHFGPGFFLENGSETGNVITRNLSMVSKRVTLGKEVPISDVRTSDPSRLSASSGFWISNPNNVVRSNVAPDAEGTGFWMSFSRVIRCSAGNHTTMRLDFSCA